MIRIVRFWWPAAWAFVCYALLDSPSDVIVAHIWLAAMSVRVLFAKKEF